MAEPTAATAEPTIPTTPAAETTAAPQSGQPAADTKKKNDLVAEKIALRERAQAAEAREKNLSEQITALTTQLDTSTKAIDELNGKVKTFEFEKKRVDVAQKAIKELPEDHAISDPDLFQKLLLKINAGDKAETEIAELVKDFAKPKQATAPAPVTPAFGVINIGGTPPSKPNAGTKFDPDNPYAMAVLARDNPAAYTQAVNEWKNQTAKSVGSVVPPTQGFTLR